MCMQCTVLCSDGCNFFSLNELSTLSSETSLRVGLGTFVISRPSLRERGLIGGAKSGFPGEGVGSHSFRSNPNTPPRPSSSLVELEMGMRCFLLSGINYTECIEFALAIRI